MIYSDWIGGELMFGKTKKYLRKIYGKPTDNVYKPDVNVNVRYHYDYARRQSRDFMIDDITWDDLNMDRIYEKSNHCLTTSGEQYLYYMLRSPSREEVEYRDKCERIKFLEENEDIRDSLRQKLYKLGRNKVADIFNFIKDEKTNYEKLIFYIAMGLTFIITLILAILNYKVYLKYTTMIAIINIILYESITKKSQVRYVTINYALGIIRTSSKLVAELKKSGQTTSDEVLNALTKLNPLRIYGGFSAVKTGSPMELIDALTLLVLIRLELVVSKISKFRDELFILHSFVGEIDASIAIGSYKKCCENITTPQIEFNADAKPYIKCIDAFHPLVDNCVSNSIDTEKSILITGSNASGKSTYLKTIGLNVILAQSLCFTFAKEYSATSFDAMSSMAISDDIVEGDSYYVAEIKSLKRILDYSSGGSRIFCILDELLRGTNTVERVAAASTILEELAGNNLICIAATHDIELTRLLANKYNQFHFREEVVEDEMTFDYKIHEGPTKSRNAIKLLSIMGFKPETIKNSESRAGRFITTGIWS